MQDLFYSSGSNSLTIIKENQTSYTLNGITSLAITASAYNTSGSEFDATVADLKIYAYSGSILVAQFPIDSTNIYYDGAPVTQTSFPISSSFYYSFTSYQPNVLGYTDNFYSSSLIYIYNSSSLSYIIQQSGSFSGGGASLTSENTYSLYISGSGSYSASILVTNTTLGSTVFLSSSVDNPLLSYFYPQKFNDYNINFYLTSSFAP